MTTQVLFYAPTFDSLGGGEVWVNRIANGLAQRGIRVHVVGKRPPQTPIRHEWDERIGREFLEPAGEVAPRRQPGWRAALDAIRRGAVGRLALALMDRIGRGWRPSATFTSDITPAAHDRLAAIVNGLASSDPEARLVIVCTDVYTGSHIAQAVAEGRIAAPFYVMHHNSFDSLNTGTARAYRAATVQAEALIALTREDADAFARSGVARTVSMHNPRPSSSTVEVGRADAKVVTWMARMTAVKAGSVAVKAWASISRRYPGWELHLYGDGPERDDLERLAERLGQRGSVRFRGVTDDPHSAFAGSAVNLLTSRFEGWPLVIGEAALHGVPTVASNNSPGVRMQIEDGVSGLLVPVGDVRATAGALARLMGDDGLRRRMGESAEAHSARFDLDVIVDEWAELLTAVDHGDADRTG